MFLSCSRDSGIFGALCREVGEEYMGQYRREGRGVTQEPGFCFGVGFVS